MGVRVNDSIAKKITLEDDQVLKNIDQGLLHQRQEEEKAREYRASVAEKKSENYILQTYIRRSKSADDLAILQAYQIQVLHKEAQPAAGKSNLHLPTKSLRRKQSRNLIMAIVGNILFAAKSVFLFFANSFEHWLSYLLPTAQARTVSVLATTILLVGVAFAAVGLAPEALDETLNLKQGPHASSFCRLQPGGHFSHVLHSSSVFHHSNSGHPAHSSRAEHSAKYLSQSKPML